jgi:hypothetical protein
VFIYSPKGITITHVSPFEKKTVQVGSNTKENVMELERKPTEINSKFPVVTN